MNGMRMDCSTLYGQGSLGQSGSGGLRSRARTHPFPKRIRRCTMRAPPRCGRQTPATTRKGKNEKTASQGVDVLQNRAKMCGSPDGNGLRARTEREAEINPEQGVDGSESRATMGGSPRRKRSLTAASGDAEENAHRVLTEAKVALQWAAHHGGNAADCGAGAEASSKIFDSVRR